VAEDSSHPQHIAGPDRLLLEGVKTMLKLRAFAVAVIAALSFSAAHAGEAGAASLKGSTHVIGVMKDVTTVSTGKDHTAGTTIQGRTSIDGNGNVIRAVEEPSIIGKLLPLLASLWLLLPVMAGACPLESDTTDAAASHPTIDSSQTNSCRDFHPTPSDPSSRRGTLGRRQEAARRHAHRRHLRCKTELDAPRRHTAPRQNSATA
jgi:hypothetical protein